MTLHATRADLERMAAEWIERNQLSDRKMQTITLPLGFVSTLAEYMDPDCPRKPGSWVTARVFPEATE